MKKLISYILAAVIAVTVSFAFRTLAHAGCTAQRIGQFTYTNCDNGYRATEQDIGNFTYGRDNQNNNWTEQDIGNFTYRNEY